MKFVKMHGLGNDFVITEVKSWEEAGTFQCYTEFICNRNIGIGADGLVLIGKDTDLDIFMRIFNSDGSEAEMCGNVSRCVGRYAYEKGWMKGNSIAVKTLAGPIYPAVEIENNLVKSVRVDMGKAVLEAERIPVKGKGDTVCTQHGNFKFTAVSMGNPHCVIFVDDIEKVPVSLWGPAIEVNEIFPAKTNVEFVQVLNNEELIMRVWERGAGITMACGTGACASLVASVLNRYTDRQATVHLLGGDLFIEWNEVDEHVYMTGPAQQVFRGSIDLEGYMQDL